MDETGSLSGKRALVTGGNRGIGLEVVRMLDHLGLRVFLGSRDPDSGAAAASEIPGVVPLPIDVADPASVKAAHEALMPEGIDVLVNNAAIRPRGAITQQDIEQAWQTNALGSWRVARAMLTPMRERHWGRIVNVSTELASNAQGQRSDIYAVTKVALNAITRALAEELSGSGILVNACSPGWCRTDMGGDGAPRSVAQGAESIVWGVSLPDDGPTGGFFQDGEPLPW
jgi:NAD(P)-dependent dehydrogenase (short-subunit alcohol dehydrogenase family)